MRVRSEMRSMERLGALVFGRHLFDETRIDHSMQKRRGSASRVRCVYVCEYVCICVCVCVCECVCVWKGSAVDVR